MFSFSSRSFPSIKRLWCSSSIAGITVRSKSSSLRAYIYTQTNQRLRPALRVTTIPILDDNYSYLLVDEANQEMHLVDPAEFEPINKIVLAENNTSGAELMSIWTTHKHLDHTAGNLSFAQEYPGIDIIGPEVEASEIPGITTKVKGEDIISPMNGKSALSIRVIDTSYHTKGHISYFIEDENKPLLFCGDSLFVGGSGRFFEGDATDCYAALYEKILLLPLNTEIYPGHEYTLSNLAFAETLEPGNEALKEKIKWSKLQRDNGAPTVPSRLSEELEFNPFLRCNIESVANAVGLSHADVIEVLAEVRRRKDNF